MLFRSVSQSRYADGGHACTAFAGEAGKSGEAGGDGEVEWVQAQYRRAIGEGRYGYSFTFKITFTRVIKSVRGVDTA